MTLKFLKYVDPTILPICATITLILTMRLTIFFTQSCISRSKGTAPEKWIENNINRQRSTYTVWNLTSRLVKFDFRNSETCYMMMLH